MALRGELAGKGLDHGPQTIAWHLHHHADQTHTEILCWIDDHARYALAEPALDDPAAALTLLWNAVAWGSDDSQRNNKARIASIAGDPDSAGALLQQAARLSREDSRAAYALLRPGDNKPATKELGPTFFTKYLYFAGGGNAHHRCCILDRNVAASPNRTCGWESLPINKWDWLATAYERYALLLDRWVDEHGIPRHDLVKRWLFEDGKTINF